MLLTVCESSGLEGDLWEIVGFSQHYLSSQVCARRLHLRHLAVFLTENFRGI
jgi:hypothetical protein